MKLFSVLRKVCFGEGRDRREYGIGEVVSEAEAKLEELVKAVTRGHIEPVEPAPTPAPAPAPAPPVKAADPAPVFNVGVTAEAKASDHS
jgi:hypothetical protein